jgi:hypothetical protein
MDRSRLGVATAMLAAAFAALMSTPAIAEPATTSSYPSGASATRLTGYAFDACNAPSLATMQAWTSSPYDGVGVYIGGLNRTCKLQPNLTPDWVTAVSKLRWRLIPIYLGHQPPCTDRQNVVKFTTATAASLGTTDAADAVLRAQALSMLPGTAIYGDMEHYPSTDSACRTAVLTYVSAWTKELHRLGYLAGMYANRSSGARHLSEAYDSSSYARPDALWIARWDGSPSLVGWAGVPNTQWANHQRGKQYRGDHDDTYGGVKINIDSNYFDAPVATVGYAYQVTSLIDLNGRSAPTTSAPVIKTYAPGSTVPVACQSLGAKVGTTSVWDKLADGTYVSDYYVSTPSKTTYSPLMPLCTYPFQVTSTILNQRTGPGPNHAKSGSLPSGALGWVTCQRSGTKVGTTSVWNKLEDGKYVSDYYMATPNRMTYSPPIPRC